MLWDMFYFNLFIFNWRIIALQYCIGFYDISTWISHRYTHPFPHEIINTIIYILGKNDALIYQLLEILCFVWSFYVSITNVPGGSDDKEYTSMQETWIWPLGCQDPLEEGMATHSIFLAWKVPIDIRTWWDTVHEVSKSRTQLND